MYDKTKEPKICENRAQSEQGGKRHLLKTLLAKLPKKPPTKLGAAVFALVVLHFVSQFVFFQSEKQTPQIENEPGIEIKTEYEAKTPEVITMPDADIPAVVKPEIETTTPSRKTMIKKKEQPRESTAERLRRAERILTGA
jgi:hypothetical protein